MTEEYEESVRKRQKSLERERESESSLEKPKGKSKPQNCRVLDWNSLIVYRWKACNKFEPIRSLRRQENNNLSSATMTHKTRFAKCGSRETRLLQPSSCNQPGRSWDNEHSTNNLRAILANCWAPNRQTSCATLDRCFRIAPQDCKSARMAAKLADEPDARVQNIGCFIRFQLWLQTPKPKPRRKRAVDCIRLVGKALVWLDCVSSRRVERIRQRVIEK